jgi:hypothetical protein
MVSKSISSRFIASSACALWLVACGSGDTSGTGAAGGSNGGAAGGSGGTTATAGSGTGGSTGGGGSAPAVATCLRGCQTGADCVVSAGAFDADNYTCNGGGCEYKGCNNDAECVTSFGANAYVCGHDPSYPYASCVRGCGTVAECKVDDGAYNAGNYTCTSGECHYAGCNTNAECDVTYGPGKYVCGTIAGFPVKYCVQGCQTSADCTLDTGAFSADNYTCVAGLCTYTGCKNDMECATTFGSAVYTCH